MPKQSSGLLDLGGTLMNPSKPVFREYVISCVKSRLPVYGTFLCLLVGERVVCSRLHAQIKTRMTQFL